MASLQMASSSRENLPEISSLPHQPTAFSFLKRSFGKKNVSLRSFQASWFRQWPFLHYDEARDVVHCHTCVMGFKEKKVKASNADPAFVSSAQRVLLSQVSRLLQLLIIMPATNATSERSFSALRRVKNYLRTTMLQQRLNNLLVLHVHKECTDHLDLRSTATEFIGDSEHRLRIYGKFE